MSDATSVPYLSHSVVLAMDYGQFLLNGGLGDGDNEYPLLEQALAAQPNAGDGTIIVVLSPHQNNFEMPIDIEVFNARPPDDIADWQQVCEDILRIGPEGVLQIDSPTMSTVDAHVPEGEYLVQVSGRGFVNYGWPAPPPQATCGVSACSRPTTSALDPQFDGTCPATESPRMQNSHRNPSSLKMTSPDGSPFFTRTG